MVTTDDLAALARSGVRLTERQQLALVMQQSMQEAAAASGAGAGRRGEGPKAGVAEREKRTHRTPEKKRRASDGGAAAAAGQHGTPPKRGAAAASSAAPMETYKPPEFGSWGSDRQQAWLKLIPTDPNAFYERYCAPGEKEVAGAWSAAEKQGFVSALKERPPGAGKEARWGFFSMHVPGRTGAQCKKLFKDMVAKGLLAPGAAKGVWPKVAEKEKKSAVPAPRPAPSAAQAAEGQTTPKPAERAAHESEEKASNSAAEDSEEAKAASPKASPEVKQPKASAPLLDAAQSRGAHQGKQHKQRAKAAAEPADKENDLPVTRRGADAAAPPAAQVPATPGHGASAASAAPSEQPRDCTTKGAAAAAAAMGTPAARLPGAAAFAGVGSPGTPLLAAVDTPTPAVSVAVRGATPPTAPRAPAQAMSEPSAGVSLHCDEAMPSSPQEPRAQQQRQQEEEEEEEDEQEQERQQQRRRQRGEVERQRGEKGGEPTRPHGTDKSRPPLASSAPVRRSGRVASTPVKAALPAKAPAKTAKAATKDKKQNKAVGKRAPAQDFTPPPRKRRPPPCTPAALTAAAARAECGKETAHLTVGLRRLCALDAPALAQTAHAVGYLPPRAECESHAADMEMARRRLQGKALVRSGLLTRGCGFLARGRILAQANAKFGTLADTMLTETGVGHIAEQRSWDSLKEHAEHGALSHLQADYASQAAARW